MNNRNVATLLAAAVALDDSAAPQEDWTPDTTPALYAEVSVDEWPEFVHPTGANPYMAGDRVTYNGAHYTSVIDNNAYSPADYPAGWKLEE